jgi:hypothetical protein
MYLKHIIIIIKFNPKKCEIETNYSIWSSHDHLIVQIQRYLITIMWLSYIYKAKRMVLQCNNGVGSNPVEGRTKIWQL